MNPNDLADLPKTLQAKILKLKTRDFMVSSIERSTEDDFITVYMYDQHGAIILIQYYDSKIDIVYATAQRIKALCDDWEAS